MEGTLRLLALVAVILAYCVISHAGTYSLTAEQCRATVRAIGVALDTKETTDSIVKGTWVSPRCEVRRIQEAVANGQKTTFLLRMIDVHNRRRWTGNYFFYQDKDCLVPLYALELQGHLGTKGGITFNITTVKVAVYSKEADKSLQTIYNKSCPGKMKSDWTKLDTHVYNVNKTVGSQNECLKSLGVDQEELVGALFQTHSINRKKVVELFMSTPDLRKQRNKGSRKLPASQQWPLQPHNSRMCLTCMKVGIGKLRHPPKLYARNSSSIDGMWGSVHCRKEGRGVYTTRFDKFSGSTYERSMFALKDSACKEANFELRTVGTLRKVSDSVEVPGGVVYEMTIKKAFLTVFSDPMARILSITPGECGKHAWETGKMQDLGPTKGCRTIGYVMGPPELVLIRTVLDENRKELYFGTDPYVGRRNKDGPVTYDVMSQDCSKFPVAFAMPTPTEAITDPPFIFPTTVEPLPTKEENVDVVEETLENKTVKSKERSRSTSCRGHIELVVFCLLLLQALRFV